MEQDGYTIEEKIPHLTPPEHTRADGTPKPVEKPENGIPHSYSPYSEPMGTRPNTTGDRHP
jgi:hypothetical protein